MQNLHSAESRKNGRQVFLPGNPDSASLHRIYENSTKKRKKTENIKKKVEIFFYICYYIIEELSLL